MAAVWAAELGAAYVVKALLWLAAGAVLVWHGLRRGAHPHGRFGAANRITLARLALAGLLVALLGEPQWAVTRAPSKVAFRMDEGVLRMILTGPNLEEIIYSGTMQQ